ncbi:MAG: hypothetical protein Q4A66_10925 [Eubacteriales bacterium]|nr:hypothetical protein [Eubacteriales bacterium]
MELPKRIDSGEWDGGHCQGIALDRENGWMYFSFTTILVKTDLQGKLLGTVTGLTGHLGCLAFCEEDGLVYGSLEYKNDAIGRGILRRLGSEEQNPDAFYMAIFDGAKIVREGMDAAGDGVMRAAYLSDVAEDYGAQAELADGRTAAHRYGCSGIDGTAIGPMFGEKEGAPVLTVAYGIYADEAREDNDYQVLLCYDLRELRDAAQPLRQEQMHRSGPKPLRRLFAYTGNTTYGIQNLEYDAHSGYYLAAVYPGGKEDFPNYRMFAFDAAAEPKMQTLRGVYPAQEGECVTLVGGCEDKSSGVRGWNFAHGDTGLIALGDGRYYVSMHGKKDEKWNTQARLFRWDGVSPLTEIE